MYDFVYIYILYMYKIMSFKVFGVSQTIGQVQALVKHVQGHAPLSLGLITVKCNNAGKHSKW